MAAMVTNPVIESPAQASTGDSIVQLRGWPTVALALLLTACGDSGGGDAESQLSAEEQALREGRRESRRCAGCHGPEGISRVDAYPSLAGLSETYMAEQLRAFRSGERDNPMMSSVARNLSDRDIEVLASYYASLPEPSRE